MSIISDTLMALHDDSASAVYARDMDSHREARAALSAAIAELIAERDAWKEEAMAWRNQRNEQIQAAMKGTPT